MDAMVSYQQGPLISNIDVGCFKLIGSHPEAGVSPADSASPQVSLRLWSNQALASLRSCIMLAEASRSPTWVYLACSFLFFKKKLFFEDSYVETWEDESPLVITKFCHFCFFTIFLPAPSFSSWLASKAESGFWVFARHPFPSLVSWMHGQSGTWYLLSQARVQV